MHRDQRGIIVNYYSYGTGGPDRIEKLEKRKRRRGLKFKMKGIETEKEKKDRQTYCCCIH